VLVVDAGVLAVADDDPDGDRARARLRGEFLTALELVDREVASALRRQALARPWPEPSTPDVPTWRSPT